MLAEAGINQTIIKKIVGHSGATTLTEKGHSQIPLKMSCTYQYICCIPATYVLHSM